jgi:site-specific DNA-cytosine methylase
MPDKNRMQVVFYTGDGVVADPIGANEANTYTNEGSGNFRLHNCVGESVVASVAVRGREGEATIEAGDDVAGCMRASQGGSDKPHALVGTRIRRLTPIECERLQGFPDDYTRIPWRGKPAEECPDGGRYKAMGNSMACNVMRWLGRRIELVEACDAR